MDQKDFGITVASIEEAFDLINLPKKKRRRFWEALGINPDTNQSEELPNLTAKRGKKDSESLDSDSTDSKEEFTSIQCYDLATKIDRLLAKYNIKTNKGVRRVKAEVLTAMERGGISNLSEPAKAVFALFKGIPRDKRLSGARATLQIVNKNGNGNGGK